MQVVARVAVCAVVDLRRLEDGVKRLRDAVDVREERIALVIGERGDLAHVQLGGDNHASAMALLLEEIELGSVQLADLDSECGEILALGAIAAGFHLIGIRQAAFIYFHAAYYTKFRNGSSHAEAQRRGEPGEE